MNVLSVALLNPLRTEAIAPTGMRTSRTPQDNARFVQELLTRLLSV